MFELTNEQRRCFGLTLVDPAWERVELPRSHYDDYDTVLYLDGCRVAKIILKGDRRLFETKMDETLSDDRAYILPKTSKGKPVKLSAAAIAKRTERGMTLSCFRMNVYRDDYPWDVSIYNADNKRYYYDSALDEPAIFSEADLAAWIDRWCAETTEEDIADIGRFAKAPLIHVKYREGDVFRFKLSRRLYGYGRILLDYNKMRRDKTEFWDIYMATPIVCSVYHIATDDPNVKIETLRSLKSLPSFVVIDNYVYYGEYEIIGNIPIGENEDYPISYGMSLDARDRNHTLHYQCGKVHLQLYDTPKLKYGSVGHGSVSTAPYVRLDILKACIEDGSNAPYWEMSYPVWANDDLRNPKHADKLRAIREQFGIS